MIPPRSVVTTWRAAEAADLLCAEFDRHIEDLETLSATVRDTCHRLDGDGWQGMAYDAVLAHVDVAHRHHQLLCQQAEALRDAGAQALSELHYTALALLDYVADAEAAGCRVADDWTVAAADTAQEWKEVIAEAVAAVERADQRGRTAIRDITAEIARLARTFDLPGMLSTGLGALIRPGPTPPAPGATGPEDLAAGDHDHTAPPTRWGPESSVPPSANSAGAPNPATCGPDEAGSQEAAATDTGASAAEHPPVVPQPGDQSPEPDADACDEAGELVVAGPLPPPEIGQDSTTSAAVTQDAPLENHAGMSAPTVPPSIAEPVANIREQLDHPLDTGSAAAVVVPPLPAPPVPPPPAGITAEQLVAIMPDLSWDRAEEYLPALNAAMQEGDITTPPRQAAFLAQLAHESCQLRYFEELGDDDYFSQYDPGQPNTAAGNTEPGDGPRYHGRGPIQLTGRGNYRAAGEALGLDLEGLPELAAQPDIGFRIAQWYWTSRNINALADAGDFAAVTQAVNGGYNGLAARQEYYARALGILG
ncbi:putative chitinase [Nocardia transvalensis]|uniref:Putative chitinase n=1 Tax=Nocardia transvalensis TaxID=37333 RepID=A0A7W9PEX4_9NOCA|nr:glycoside hydrolase family 19 protein [Nocardia transvalensis]MBB5914736.1 putative chitinase [Nocardia transvalensis]